MHKDASDPGSFDIAAVRALYPALADGHAYLDGAAGTQVPVPVIEAISAAYRGGIGNLGGAFAASDRAGEITAAARAAVADLVGGSADGIVFGPSATAHAYRTADALSRAWTAGDDIVVSRLDHDSNVRPWIQVAGRAGVTVHWAEADLVTGELPVAQYAELVGPRTRLVAVTAASNAIGTRPDVAAIAAIAHDAGALCYVDGVHATPHVPVDVTALGADFYTTSAYKWSGPHVAALAAAPELLETIWPDKLAPSSNAVPWRFERGTLPFADLAGVTAAVEHLAALAPGAAADGSRRERVLASMAAIEAYESALFTRLLGGLAKLDRVTLYGNAARRAPTAFFSVADVAPRAVAEHLAARSVNVWDGDNYAYELCTALGLEPDGAVRAGLVHYNDVTDVDRLLAGLAELAG
ncbi:cysteine desulfurase-like protein [Trebonia kvetii]|uniref:Cysteine desulfurase-like protein n=1 Tax=Trebonia kvetii TaxID=2480626 RepID=A0A6P2C2V7_9ACTN|nr:cysteine desulfurase-like protein [Trebonia kvetii]TVZ05704.1 cysteine desulfurase-like protein [Trebonia kvetii]